MGLPPTEERIASGDADVQGEAAAGVCEAAAFLAKEESGRGLVNDTIFARVSSSSLFQNTTLIVIVFNAIWIGVDVEFNHMNLKKDGKLPLEPWSIVVEQLFCFYFSFELLVRFLSFRRKCDCTKDGWFVFDGTLVFFMVLENWILAIIALFLEGGSEGLLSKFSALRLLRLLRLTRMTRIIAFVPELVTLLKGMLSATKAVFFILMFLVLCMYVFAIIFTAQLGDPDAPERYFEFEYWESNCEAEDNCDRDPTAIELFGSLGDSMMSLFTRGMLADNLAETLQAIKDAGGEIICEDIEKYANGSYVRVFEGEAGPTDRQIIDSTVCSRTGGSSILFWVFLIFMIISAFCLLNMLIGVLCEVIDDSAAKENESTQISELKRNMATAFTAIDSSQDGLITSSEWSKMKSQPEVRASMANLGVEEQYIGFRLGQMQESLFGNAEGDIDGREGLTFEQFISKVMEIRPDTDASALDIELLRTRVEREEMSFTSRLDFVEEALKSVNNISPEIPAKAAISKPVPVISPSAVKAEETTNLSVAWLREVPTEVLFAVLNSRSPPHPTMPQLLDPPADSVWG
jgi:hypothetical protein